MKAAAFLRCMMLHVLRQCGYVNAASTLWQLEAETVSAADIEAYPLPDLPAEAMRIIPVFGRSR
jgi:hypothetical protein